MKCAGLYFFTCLAVLSSCSFAPHNTSVPVATPIDRLKVSCIGPSSAETFIIYLHGIDSIVPSEQELENRRVLGKIAKVGKVRLALPRAEMKCPHQMGSVCWGWKFDELELSQIIPKILNARLECFGKDKPFWILGFSNGGNLLVRWYARSMNPKFSPLPAAMIAVGSGKTWVDASIVDLSKNPALTLMVGQQDQSNFDPSGDLFKRFKNLKAPVRLVKFQGGHLLDESSLREGLLLHAVKKAAVF